MLRKQGLTVRTVAEKVGCVPSSVVRWTQAIERAGERGLDSKPQSGGKARLTERQRRSLCTILVKGPRAWGWSNDLWTLERVAQVIERRFGVTYHISHVHRLLRQLGFSAQKPARLARERNDAAVAEFRDQRWAAVKKKRAARSGPSFSSMRAALCCNRWCAELGRLEERHPCSGAGTDTTGCR
jgi:transposase